MVLRKAGDFLALSASWREYRFWLRPEATLGAWRLARDISLSVTRTYATWSGLSGNPRQLSWLSSTDYGKEA